MGVASVFSAVAKFFGGDGIGSTIVDTIAKRFPPSMSEAEKAQAKLELTQVVHAQQIELLRLGQEQDAAFDKRVAELEGTAADLKTIPIVGSVMLFLRGCQRPVWGFGTLYLDFMWFSGGWTFSDDQTRAAAYVINVLVLGFLFGERAMQNVLPYIENVFKARAAGG